MKKYNKQGMH